MTDQDKISYIIQNELIMFEAVFNGHKASTGDQFQEIREKINQYRLELGIVKPSKN